MRRGTGRTRQQGDPSRRSQRWLIKHIRSALLLCLASVVLASSWSCGLLDRNQPAAVVTGDVSGPRIVVLPFVNIGNGDDDFFAAGMTDEIAERLAAVAGLVVISDSGSTGVEAEGRSLDWIGDELGAEYVLSGTVRRETVDESGTKLFADLRLVRVNDNDVLWSETYDRSMSDIFAVQADTVINIVEVLGVTVEPAARRLLELKATANMEAYEAYLHGLAYRWSFELKELGISGDSFKRAVELDPEFAPGYVALSENHSLMFHFRYDRSPQRLANAIAAAHRALELQPDLPEGHRALGYYYYWGQRNFEQALSEFSMAAAGRPNDPLIVSSIGIVLRRQGRWDEAMDAFKRVLQLDPKSEINAMDLASTYGRMRLYTEGVAHCQRAIELSPDDIFPYIFMARMLRTRDGSIDGAREILQNMPDKDPGQQGFFRFEQALYERDYAGAIEWLTPTEELISDPISEEIFPRPLAECAGRVLGGAPAGSVGACAEARSTLERSREISPVDPAVHAALGWTYALLSDPVPAIEAGERAVELLPVSADAMAGHSYLVRLAKIYAWSDEPFAAVKTIEKAMAMPGWLSLATLEHDPDWDPIRSDPRFQELLRIHGTGE
ncbi:MAG: tetratricopeptide repeat protein [Acidobacteriota bacterium]|nr:tetratricopeptide repeat protein [Acidobacteriota bacterium]